MRILDAARHPHLFLRRRDYHFKSSVVSLSDKGIQRLIDEHHLADKPARPRPQYAHELGAAIAQASIELGARKHGLEYFDWRTLRTHDNMPAKQATSTDPFRFMLDDKHYHYFDRPPFVLQTPTETIAFFMEFDRFNEDLGGTARITIEKKLANIKTIWQRKLWQQMFDFDRAMLLWVSTIDEDDAERPIKRQHAIMKRVEKVIGPCSYILFTSVHDFERCIKSIKPHTDLVDNPWMRVGHRPFDLKELREL